MPRLAPPWKRARVTKTRAQDERSEEAIGPRGKALLLGWAGGFGQALLGVLEQTDAGKAVVSSLEALFLLDAKPVQGARVPPFARVLPPERVTSGEQLARLVQTLGIDQVIDASRTRTLECIHACAEIGASYMCGSIEAPGERTTTRDLARLLLPGVRPAIEKGSYLVGSGMNPGIVNALALLGLEELSKRVGLPPDPEALGLEAIYVTESDTTTEIGAAGRDVFAMTWSPRQCLAELLEPRAFVVRKREIVELDHSPREARYRARCGDQLIEGMLVPHEEVVTLAERLPSIEVGFIYELPSAAQRILERYPVARELKALPIRRLYPPHVTALEGYDRAGVLLVTRSFGELWLGFQTDVKDGLRLGTNATELQVAAGALAGWNRLGERRGIHCVEELDPRAYMATVTSILGPYRVVHDEAAPARLIEERRCSPDR